MMGAGRSDETRRVVELDKECVWHPFTPMRQWLEGREDPGRVIVAGEGFELIDSRGRRFIDGFGSLWCNLHGHRVPEIDGAIRAQLGKIAHSTLLGHVSGPSIRLGEKLAGITPPGLEKVFYSDSGAAAVEVALKMAYQFYRNRRQHGRRRFLGLRGGYHGDTIGAMSLGGIDTFGEIFRPLLFETTFVDSPNAYHHPAGTEAGRVVLDQIEKILTNAAGEYCAVVIEPLVQGAGGILTHPSGFLRSVRELTDRYDVLLIADEVATGLCRTGRLFACEHEQVTPDLMPLGKALTGGYLPVAATMTTQRIFDAFCADDPEDVAARTFYHGHTYTGNALGCAAAEASIDLIFSSALPEKLDEKVALIRNRLGELADHPNVADVRQCGMMIGIELVEDRPSRRAFDASLRIGAKVCFAARRYDIIIRPLGDVVVLMPAPGMDIDTLDRLLGGTVRTINEYFAQKI